jgi:hypothetical protein
VALHVRHQRIARQLVPEGGDRLVEAPGGRRHVYAIILLLDEQQPSRAVDDHREAHHGAFGQRQRALRRREIVDEPQPLFAIVVLEAGEAFAQ